MAEQQLIFKLLADCMAGIGAIGKGQRNQSQGYSFRGIDDVLMRVGPVLAENHVIPSVARIEDHKLESYTENTRDGKTRLVHRASLKMCVRFSAPDGSFVENWGVGEAIDYGGDKASNKAMSAAYKYAVFLGLCVPVKADDVADSDRDARPTDEATGIRKQRPRSNGKPAKPDIENLPPAGKPGPADGPGDEARYIKLLTFIADCQDEEKDGVMRTRKQRLTELRFALMGTACPYPSLSAREKKNLGTLIDKTVADIECSRQPEFSR